MTFAFLKPSCSWSLVVDTSLVGSATEALDVLSGDAADGNAEGANVFDAAEATLLADAIPAAATSDASLEAVVDAADAGDPGADPPPSSISTKDAGKKPTLSGLP
eukprot:COSAG06_NODE_42324_length_382_cov_8.756184_1_plen_104_part_10